MIKDKMLKAAAGNAGEPLYVDDVFSTYVYTGNASTQTITNGIDLATEGGMVWIKDRDIGTVNHALFDTERGVQLRLSSNTTSAEITDVNSITAFNSNGFSIGSSSTINNVNDSIVSWTFRKAPKFFDVVTYTGNGSAGRTVSHNLGSVPGCIIVKRLNTTGNWAVYHRANTVAPETDHLQLNLTDATVDDATHWNDTAPTSTVFTVGTNAETNASGGTYVAYLFAHNNNDGEFGTNGDEDIIKCGSYTLDGSSQASVTLGFEPQYLLLKTASTTGGWAIYDHIRGVVTGGTDSYLLAHAADAEVASDFVEFTPTGFNVTNGVASAEYIYIAIRRPHKPAESGSEVFAVDTAGSTGDGKEPQYRSPFPVDFSYVLVKNVANNRLSSARLIQGKYLSTNLSSAETTIANMNYDYMNGWRNITTTDSNYYSHMFKRSPGFMDVVCYESSGLSNTTSISHNLGAVPELMLHKQRDAVGSWLVYEPANKETHYALLHTNGASVANSDIWASTLPTSSDFTIGNVINGGSVKQMIAILFATQAGISKVGSYTGNGTSQTIDCGFTTGARFVLIKRTDSTGDWFVWDSLRGIVAGNDPFIILNDTDAEDTLSSGTGAAGDHLDPDSSGFIVNETTGVAINTSSAEYIYLAIA